MRIIQDKDTDGGSATVPGIFADTSPSRNDSLLGRSHSSLQEGVGPENIVVKMDIAVHEIRYQTPRGDKTTTQ
jgi:hypothetical protein